MLAMPLNQRLAQEAMVAAAQALGKPAETYTEVWKELVGVQVEVAYDRQAGSECQTAYKLVGEAAGLLAMEETRQGVQSMFQNLTQAQARFLYDLLEEISTEEGENGTGEPPG
jgi:hypothetical protein